EKIIRIFLNPAISGLLILIIVGGIYFELQTPGVGFPILAAFVALIMYFVPYYLNGLAENWEIALFFVGVALIAVELFVLPGFGVAGILGLVLTIGSLVLVMLNNDALDFTFVVVDDIVIAISTTLAGLLGAIVLMFVGGVRLTNTAFFKKISLQDIQLSTDGFSSKVPGESIAGKTGTTYTVLRPSGKIIIDGNMYDAYTRGEFIDAGQEIIVIEESGTSVRVKEIK
ncbi:MAG: nodulation protein NfeD, partial [Cyclobacteriaceae bacterium]